MEFRFDPKGLQTLVLMQSKLFALNDAKNRSWFNPVVAECGTMPLKEGKKESHMFWELPYGESYDFAKFLERCYRGQHSHFFVGQVRISTFYLHNEVGEPFYEVYAKLPFNVLRDILDVIKEDYFYHKAQECGFDPVQTEFVPDSMNGLK